MADAPNAETCHATAIAIAGRAVLIRGPSGSGKSDLALRCLGLSPGLLCPTPFELVADDRVIVAPSEEGLTARAPLSIKGLIEVRGFGIIELPAVDRALVALVADIVPPGQIERMPDACSVDVLGYLVPRVAVAPFEPSAPLKVAMVLQRTISVTPPVG